MIDVPHPVDPKQIDILLTDVTGEDLRRAFEDENCLTLIDDPVEILEAKGFMFGEYDRLLILLPVTVLRKTMMIPFLIDTGSPYTFLSTDAFSKYGLELPTDDKFMSCLNGTDMRIHFSPEKSHFAEICVLGSDYLYKSSSKLTCFYASRVFLLEKGKGVAEWALPNKRRGGKND
jgi:hypothetical protein